VIRIFRIVETVIELNLKKMNYFLLLTLFFPLLTFSNDLRLNEKSPQKPNVLFIAIDDINDWTGFLGENSQAITPNMDRLAEEAMVFTNAYCSAPVCGPSRTSLLYGIYPHKSGSYGHHVVYNPQNIAVLAERLTLPALFKSEGYYTAGAGKICHYGITEGYDTYFNTGDSEPNPDSPDTYIPDRNLPRPLGFTFGSVRQDKEKDMGDYQITEWAIHQLNQKLDRPFFIGVGYKKPHLPWIAKQSNFEKFDIESISIPEIVENDLDDVPEIGKEFAQSLFGFYKMEKMSDHEFVKKQPMYWKKLVRAYLASINHTDEMIGKLLDALNKSQYKNNTIIVLWGDHGWHLGEKEHWRKMTLWRKGTRTPLIIYAPDKAMQGYRFEYPVSLQNIYPTLVDLCELKTSQKLDGNSLAPVLANPKCEWNHPVLISHGPGNFAICYEDWRYIRYFDGSEDAEMPNYEYSNLIEISDFQMILEKCRSFVPGQYEKILGPRFKQFY